MKLLTLLQKQEPFCSGSSYQHISSKTIIRLAGFQLNFVHSRITPQHTIYIYIYIHIIEKALDCVLNNLGLNLVRKFGRTSLDGISDSQKDVVFSYYSCELRRLQLVHNHWPRIRKKKLFQTVRKRNCFQPKFRIKWLYFRHVL